MDYQRFTDQTKRYIQLAQTLAGRRNNPSLEPEHLLKVMIDEADGPVTKIILKQNGDLGRLHADTDYAMTKFPSVTGSGAGQMRLATDLKKIMEEADYLASKAGDTFITPEYIVLAMSMAKAAHVAEILSNGGVTPESLNEGINNYRKGRTVNDISADANMDALKKYATDVTEAAREGKIDPIIGRDEEIRRAIQVLSRRTKNNPVLLGEPGVGKTAIAEGLALRMVNGDVPESLKDKKLLSLDLAALIAGTEFRGEFESRLKAVLDEIKAADGEIVLFLDELHTLVGAGKSEGSMDAGNMLKPALARGELRLVGATTLSEYKKYIEKDPALARRFQPVYIQEPTVADTISILRGIKEKYELHHGVRITDSALVAAATLSNRYITDRFLPDKAIDLVDEAASRLRMQVDSKPEELDEIDRRLTQLKIEREALKKEEDKASKKRLEDLEEEIDDLQAQSDELTEKWKAEKEKLGSSQKLAEELDKARIALEKAEREGDWTKAGELTYSVIPSLQKQLAEADAVEQESAALIEEKVTEDHIAEGISRWTGIPVSKMMEGERDKLLKLEEHLAKRVVGQDQAVVAVSEAVRRSRAGLQDPNRPIGSFIFLGPTGVGKTELTKALAEFLFDDDSAMIRIDMSEYMEKHSVSRLIGAPPGYVGYDEGGALTEAVRRRPYQVVLFDEIEKAHPDVFNILLQVLDDGRLTDGQGRLVDFTNTLLIMTSNIGAQALADQVAGADVEEVRDQVMEQVRGYFRPEFINRIDEILLFRRLSRDHMTGIVEIQLKRLERLLEPRRITLDISPAAKEFLAERGYDPVYGARPLKRVIQKELQNKLSELILKGDILDGAKVGIDHQDDVLTFSVRNPKDDKAEKSAA